MFLPFKIGTVNCYVIQTDKGFILIDTGSTNRRDYLEKELEISGCRPGNLKLIIITHGDFDHIGNAAYLSQKYGSKTAMHKGDSGMAENGNMFFNRKQPNFIIGLIAKLLFRLKKSDRFKPDLLIEDGHDLGDYGLNAKVLNIPGHSKGSIGIFTERGDLFCGDLFENTKKPVLNSIMDDIKTAKTSIEKLKSYKIITVYPGHGKPFSLQQFLENFQKND